MRIILSFLLSLIVVTSVISQDAGTVIEEVLSRFETLGTYSIDFNYTMEIPESDNISQKGHLICSDNRFNLTLSDQQVISDGSNMYVHLITVNEVHIMEVSEENAQGFFSPKDIVQQYDNEKEYSKHYLGIVEEDGQVMEQIEFIPNDKSADVFKTRLTITSDDKNVVRVKTFHRDGSRQVLTLNSLNENPTVNQGLFVFDASKYPGIHIEDLR